MALDDSFLLEYAGVPFTSDTARVFRTNLRGMPEVEDPEDSPLRKQQPHVRLLDELDKMLAWEHLDDFQLPGEFYGRNLDAVARRQGIAGAPGPSLRVGEWFYPNTASRWSVFRGLMTSAMVKAVVANTGGVGPAKFVMKNLPVAPGVTDSDEDDYTLETQMHMLPPRPLGEHVPPALGGLFLMTLVDSRYYFQGSPCIVRPTPATTWPQLVNELAAVLDIEVGIPSAINAAYGTPQPDSQLWASMENAAYLLDAVAYNIGRVVVRQLDGSYNLLTPLESAAAASANRGVAAKVFRTAGGNLFGDPDTKLPAGDLRDDRNSVVPSTVRVTFPKYIKDPDPVPHFFNPRYQAPRPSSWCEDGYGDTFTVDVPIQSGGPSASGLAGTGDETLTSTAKALYSGEIFAASGQIPLNLSGLTSLAMRLAGDLYDGRVAMPCLDEVYPGCVNPTSGLEGNHDVVWTFSEDRRQASTRVIHTGWTAAVLEFQHAEVPLSGYASGAPGAGGQSVAQTWRHIGSSGAVGIGALSGVAFGRNLVTVGSGMTMTPEYDTSGGIAGVLLGLASGGGGAAVSGSFASGTLIGLVAAEDSLDSAINLNGTYQTLRQLTLPSSGQYLIWGFAGYQIPPVNPGNHVNAQLWDNTLGSRINFMNDITTVEDNTSPAIAGLPNSCATLQALYAATGPNVIQLQALVTPSGVAATANKPSLIYLRVQ